MRGEAKGEPREINCFRFAPRGAITRRHQRRGKHFPIYAKYGNCAARTHGIANRRGDRVDER